MAKQETETAIAETAETNPAEFDDPGYVVPGTSFRDLAESAVSLPGYELADDALLDALIGVEFVITRVNIRVGDVSRRENNMWRVKFPDHEKGGYASLEITLTDNFDLRKINRARAASKMAPVASVDLLGIDEEDTYVFNDGSTGIYRQILAFLAMENYIVLPDGPLDGKAGQTVLDTIPQEWQDVNVGDLKFDKNGNATYAANVRIRCKRGIRKSDYESEFNPDSHTRYLQ